MKASYHGNSGKAFYIGVVSTKVTKRLAGVDNCVVSSDDFVSLLAVNKEFEKWSDLQSLRTSSLI